MSVGGGVLRWAQTLQVCATRLSPTHEDTLLETAAYCLQQQVCPHCVLRLLGLPANSIEYGDAPPPSDALQQQLAALRAATGQTSGDTLSVGTKRCADDHNPPEHTRGAENGASELAAELGAGRQAKRACQAEHVPSAHVAGPATGSASGSEAAQGEPGACPVCLGILQLISGSVSASTPTAELCDHPPLATQPTPRMSGGAPAPEPLPDARPSTLAARALAAGTVFASFGIELAVPATTACREHALHAHLTTRFQRLVGLDGWRASDVTKLKAVAQRMLRGPLGAALQQPHKDAAQADLSLQLSFSHEPSHAEHVAVTRDYLESRQRKQQARFGGRGQRGRWGRGRGSGAFGRGPPGHAASDTPSDAAGGEAQVGLELQEALASMNAERAQSHLASLSPSHLRQLLPWPPSLTPTPPCQPTLKLHRAPLLLAGRYLKTRRGVPQTCWMDLATGLRIGGVSAAERIDAHVLPAYGAAASKFMSGGREDADVRMLGTGRPFVLELLQPQRAHPGPETLRAIEDALVAEEHGVRVVGLKPCSKDALERLKEAEQTKEKSYQALCWCSRALDEADVAVLQAVKRQVVMQDTPVRVLHRRASKIRDKHVSVEEVRVLDGRPQYFVLRLRTQAGAYVKEFCHGDWGRSDPCLADILGGGVRCEILQLDVLAVHMEDWP